jgi:transcriptional regulator with XRE-family HTH domain
VHPPTNRIRELRKTSKHRLYELAGALKVDTSTITRWENGTSEVPDAQKRELAVLFGVSIAYLMGWEDAPGVPPKRPRQRRRKQPTPA